jgi:hypothetical protein
MACIVGILPENSQIRRAKGLTSSWIVGLERANYDFFG